MPVYDPHTMLVGRSAETEAVDRLLEGARSGRSGVLVVRGEAGIGKSALLQYAASSAAGTTILRSVGTEAESGLAFAGLHQILRPLLGGIDDLPDLQAAALRSAFALSSETGGDRFRISLGVLALLAEAAEAQPVLVLVDDAQWVDGPSTDALLFAVRRLEAERVAVLLAARDDDTSHFAGAGLPELRLSALARSDARLVAAEHLGANLLPVVLEWVVDNAGGNPLALVELPRSLSPRQLAGLEPLAGVLPATTSLEQRYLERVERLPPTTRSMLIVVAAEGTGDRRTCARAAAELATDPNALAAAEAAGLVRVRAERIDFRHPLVRSAAYRAASFAERERAHRALADVLDDEADADRRAWQRAAATSGPGAEVADELERTADRARRRSGYAAAAAALERAGELSVEPESKARRLVNAAAAAWHAGQPSRATALLDTASPLVTDANVLAELDHLRGQIEWRCGSFLDAGAILLAGAARIAPVDSHKALEMLFDAAMTSVLSGDFASVSETGRRAAALPRAGDAGDAFRTELLIQIGALSEGKAAADVPQLLETLDRAEKLDDPYLLVWAAVAAALAGEESKEAALHQRAATQARASGAIDALVHVLTSRAVRGVLTGRFDVATEASEGLRLAQETGLQNVTNPFRAVLAWFAAVSGKDEQCRTYAAEVSESARVAGAAMSASLAEWGRALLDLRDGRLDETVDRLLRLRAAPPGIRHPLIVKTSTPDLVEACVRTGRSEDAQAAREALEQFARPGAPTWALALAARCRALLAHSGTAESEFEEAVRLHSEGHRPFDSARTELLFGEHLRRTREPLKARAHFRAALEIFETLGASPWAERARSELRASGEATSSPEHGALYQLTAQEQQVAQLVAQGLSNREVGAQLFLSPRTIEFHLRKVYRKLGIASRVDLARLVGSTGATSPLN